MLSTKHTDDGHGTWQYRVKTHPVLPMNKAIKQKGEGSEGVKICGIGSLKNKKTFTGEKDATSFFLTSRAFLKTCTSFYCSLLRLFLKDAIFFKKDATSFHGQVK